jgi:hypothetical protein
MQRSESQIRKDAALLDEYAASWVRFADGPELTDDEVPDGLAVGTDENGGTTWRPQKHTTDPAALAELYAGLGLPGTGPTRLPPLYEQFVLSYRWARVDLGRYSLLPNGPASGLGPLLAAMREHDYLRSTFQPNGYLPFAQGPEFGFDAVCFDLRHRQKNGDCRIVQLDHEMDFSRFRIEETAELATSFRELVIQTIHAARREPKT